MCLTCVDPNRDGINCRCKKGYYQDISNSCLGKFVIYIYFLIKLNNFIIECNKSCRTCSGDKNVCTSCNSDKIYDNPGNSCSC